jgi:hypothetical protein
MVFYVIGMIIYLYKAIPKELSRYITQKRFFIALNTIITNERDFQRQEQELKLVIRKTLHKL